MKITTIVITDGRFSCLERTVDSYFTNVWCHTHNVEFNHILVNDSMDINYRSLVDALCKGRFQIHHNQEKKGFGGAIQTAWSLIPEDTDFIFHLEDDFLFNEELNLEDMLYVLRRYPHIAQLVLKRQPWNEQESKAGGIIEMWPDLYKEWHVDDKYWCEHRVNWSTNPSLYPARIIKMGWPQVERSEEAFSKLLFSNPSVYCAYWGKKFDPPLVTHIGNERVGIGY